MPPLSFSFRKKRRSKKKQYPHIEHTTHVKGKRFFREAKKLPPQNFIVLDAGSDMLRAGFSASTTVEPKILAPYHAILEEEKSICPVTNGVFLRERVMKEVLNRTFEMLEVDPEGSKVLMCQDPLNPRYRKSSTAIVEFMFEDSKVEGLQLVMPPILELWAHGRHTGVVVGSGTNASYAVPVYDKHVLYWPPHKEGAPWTPRACRLDVGGSDVTNYLEKQLKQRQDLKQRNIKFSYETVVQLKETMCQCSLDLQGDEITFKREEWQQPNYKLPDGCRITVGFNEQFLPAEVLFQPSMVKSRQDGIHVLLDDSISRHNMFNNGARSRDSAHDIVQEQLYKNIVLAGGTTMLTQFKERIAKEVKMRLPSGIRADWVNVEESQNVDARNLAFVGGCMAASTVFKEFCITRQDYFDSGPSAEKRHVNVNPYFTRKKPEAHQEPIRAKLMGGPSKETAV